MDPNLLSIVLFVALCWMSFGTNALNDTSVAANTTISSISITAPENTSSIATGVMMTNATAVASNVTTPVPTENTSSNANGVMMTNATAVASNVTTPVPTENTSSNATGVMTTNATAVASNVTAPAPPLVPDTTVVDLSVRNVSSDECGSTQLCATEPSSCDPSKSDSCFFLGAKQTSGFNFLFSLSGASAGYLAATLFSQSRGNDTVYICAKNNGVVKFIPALYSNGQFFDAVLPVNNVKGKINGNKIQCTFAVTVPTATTKAADISFALGVETGTFDTTTGKKGNPTLKIKTAVLDLSNPNQIVTNLLAPTTSGAITLQQSVSQAVLIVLGFLSLAML